VKKVERAKKNYYWSIIMNFQLISLEIPFFNFFITSTASPTEKIKKWQNSKLTVQSVH